MCDHNVNNLFVKGFFFNDYILQLIFYEVGEFKLGLGI